VTTEFETIGLIGKNDDTRVAETLASLCAHLQGRHNLLVETTTAAMLGDQVITTVAMEALRQRCDLAIVVGGDGTLLHAGHCFADAGPPLLGINLGRLGFLVDISPNDMLQRVDEVLAGQYIREERLVLKAGVSQRRLDGEPYTALNDVLLHKHNTARMIEFETSINGQFLNRQRSDGLIISTPTGSTAYALSGGGPIVHPSLNAIVLVPICPHTLSNRPIVLSGDSVVEITIAEGQEDNTQITCDGQSTFSLSAGDRLRIEKSPRGVQLLHPQSYDYYESLRARLRWAGHH
jgi:NAD+ kinase